ncbi:hypothetical protein FACS189449_08230 [Alphaproteobacteria bacterium]|nr:hypothetical protein FACS189449_08230 [Alphaproteobacteria bacterium]
MSLLPFNSTKSERNIAEAIDYKVNSDVLAGFKFRDTELKLVLAYEYSLAQVNIDDFAEMVKKRTGIS